MALVLADLVQETTSTTGTGTLTLTGPVPGYQSFAAIGTGNTTYYRIKSGEDSEVGIGTYTLSGTTLSRDTVLYSSAGGTTKITVAAGATVICTYPAERAVALVSPVLSGSLADPLLDLTQAWGGTTGNPTAIKLNVTGTAGSTAKLMDLQVGGASKFSVDKSGNMLLSTGSKLISNSGAADGEFFLSGPSNGNMLSISDLGLVQASGVAVSWSSGAVSRLTADLKLYRDAANTLAQRNSTNSQTSRIYNTYTTASDWERLSLGFATYSGAIYAKLAVEGGGTSAAANIGIALSPKGTGAITAQVPDGTTVGGNARGANSVDLQMGRLSSDQVASGSNAVVLGGYGNQSAQVYAVSMGKFGIANKFGQVAIGLNIFASAGDMQYSYMAFAGLTTNTTITEIFLSNNTGYRATIPNSTTWAADIDIVARSLGGTENAYFKRRVLIQKGTTAASTALIGAVQTIGTDIGSTNMLAITTPITLSADTTNGTLKLEVTGIAATNIRWVAKVSLVEVGYA